MPFSLKYSRGLVEMNSKVLFEDPINLLKLIGFQFSYEKGVYGNLKKLLAFLSVLCVVSGIIFQSYYMFTEDLPLIEIIPFISTVGSNLEVLVKFFSLFLLRKDFVNLINEMKEISERGLDQISALYHKYIFLFLDYNSNKSNFQRLQSFSDKFMKLQKFFGILLEITCFTPTVYTLIVERRRVLRFRAK